MRKPGLRPQGSRGAGLLTCCLRLARLAPLQVHAKDVTERSQLDEGQSGDLLHVLRAQVSNLRQAKPAFGDPKLLGREVETIKPGGE